MPLKTPVSCSIFMDPCGSFLFDMLPLAVLVFQDMAMTLAESESFWKIGFWLEFLLLVDICAGHSGLYAYMNSLYLEGIMSSKPLLINFICTVSLWNALQIKSD